MIRDSKRTVAPTLRLVERASISSGNGADVTSVHRFPPVVQVLNPVLPHIQERMQGIATMGFRRGLDDLAICDELSSYARTFDSEATIGIQRVSSDQMPSFQGDRVASTFVMVDLNPTTNRLRLYKSCASGARERPSAG